MSRNYDDMIQAMCPVCVDERYCDVLEVCPDGYEVECLACGEQYHTSEIYGDDD